MDGSGAYPDASEHGAVVEREIGDDGYYFLLREEFQLHRQDQGVEFGFTSC